MGSGFTDEAAVPPASAHSTNLERSGFGGPLRSEFGTHQTVRARFWPWLEPSFRQKSLTPLEVSKLLPSRSAAAEGLPRTSVSDYLGAPIW